MGDSPDAVARLAVDPTLDVASCLSFVKVATRRVSATETWWASRTPGGPASLRLRRLGNDVVDLAAWGDGADWMLRQAPVLLGDNPSGFTPHHDLIARLVAADPKLHLPRTDRVLEAAIPAVLGQKVQTVAAMASLRGLAAAHGETAPGPERLRLLPEPAELGALGYHTFHPFNVERKRAATIIGLARRADWLEGLGTLPAEERRRKLQLLPGVGPWTAAVIAMSAWADADAVPVGDFHIPNTVSWALAGEERGDDARMLELLEPYAGHRARVVRLLKGHGVHAPRRGPKLGVIDNRRR